MGNDVTTCNVCGGPQRPALDGMVLGHHAVTYQYCDACGFLNLPDPHWLDEAYSDAIAALDTGIVDRTMSTADRLAVMLHQLYPDGPYLDVGGGHGLLVRRMRDLGFDFRWQDEYADNLYARNFEDHGGPYEVVTAFALLEHLTDPAGDIARWVKDTGAQAFVFDQVTFEGEPPRADWWYYAPTAGQHISFFQPRTLALIAEQIGMEYLTVAGFHCFTSGLPQNWGVSVLGHPRIASLSARMVRRRRGSLVSADFAAISAG